MSEIPKYVVVMEGSTILDEFTGKEGTVPMAPARCGYSHFVGNLHELEDEAECLIHFSTKSNNIYGEQGYSLKRWSEE